MKFKDMKVSAYVESYQSTLQEVQVKHSYETDSEFELLTWHFIDAIFS